MCIMTLIDIDKEKLPELNNSITLRKLLVLNQLLGNSDGFGYYLFHNKQLVKTKNYASKYFIRHYLNQFSRYNSYNGIYHVRKASGLNTTNYDKIIKDENSHPFLSNNLIVTHNGSLSERDSHIDFDDYKDILSNKDIIDSEKFTKVLSKIVEQDNGITLEGINKAVNFFGGAFCFFIHDKKVNDFVWVVRGKNRTLFKLTILDDNDSPIGTIINTAILPLNLLQAELYPINTEIKELKEQTAFTYMLNSYELEEVGIVEENQSFKRKPKEEFAPVVVQSSFLGTSTEKILNILALVEKGFLSLKEIYYLFFLTFNKSFMLANSDDIGFFLEFLETLFSEDFYDGRKEIWLKLLDKFENKPRLNVYELLNLEFPYFLNTKFQLEQSLRIYEAKEKNSNNKNNRGIIKINPTSSSNETNIITDKGDLIQ